MALAPALTLAAINVPVPKLDFGMGPASRPEEVATSLQLLFLLTVLSLAPTILILLTSFTRIIIVFSFVRNALGTQQVPPTQVLTGLALFLTFFIMKPTIDQINANALQPYLKHTIAQGAALDRAQIPLRQFMFKQTREKDIALFFSISKTAAPKKQADVPTYLLIPAFILSEIYRAFQIGFAIYIPFVVIDMVVASILLSMGMMMIPPATISMPFKILIFLLVDGWNLTVNTLFTSFK